MTYNMEEFFESCLTKYQDLAGPSFKFKKVPTPFIEELIKKGPCAPTGDGEWLECGWCKSRLKPEEFRHGKGRHYTPAHGCGGVATATESETAEDDIPRGALADIASSILMKVLYGARMARFDLLRAVCALASCVTKWDKDCDRKLHRLMCYLHTTKHYRQVG